MGLKKDLLPPQEASNNSMRAPQIYSKFDQDLLFQIRISARASKINDMAVRQRRNEQTHPSRGLPGRCAAAAHDRGRKTTGEGGAGELRGPEGEGGRGRAAEAGRRGRPEEREGERPLGGRPYGEQRGVVREGGGAIWCGQGRFF